MGTPGHPVGLSASSTIQPRHAPEKPEAACQGVCWLFPSVVDRYAVVCDTLGVRKTHNHIQMNTIQHCSKAHHVINCHAQELHEDSRVYINECDRRSYGGARVIDALTFVKNHPAKFLRSMGGTWYYEGDLLNRTTEETHLVMNVPECYEANDWSVG